MKYNHFPLLALGLLAAATAHSQGTLPSASDSDVDCVHFSTINHNTDAFAPPRSLDEINREKHAESYPHLSPDGLRLYYTHEGEDLKQGFFMVSRDNINGMFRNPQPLVSEFMDGALSCWLTNDELEVYYASERVLYCASRSSLTGNFSHPVELTLVGVEDDTFISGPSMTPDKQELYLFQSTGDGSEHEVILRLKKTGHLTYTLVEKLTFPDGYVPGPGQLSKDGLAFYFSLELGNLIKICRLNRRSLTGHWENLSELTGLACEGDLQQFQPSVSQDEKVLTYVVNNGNSWYDNDLHIANASQVNQPTFNTALYNNPQGDILVYPNPATEQFTISTYEVTPNSYFALFDMNGRELFRKPLLQTITQVDISQLPSGIYLVKFIYNNEVQSVRILKQ